MKLNDFLKIPKEELVGKIICFPTDTVYGVAAMFNDKEAAEKIYQLKERDIHKALPVLAGNLDDVLKYVEIPNPKVTEIMKEYWPGALTIIFNKKNDVKYLVNEEFKTIGFRIPNSLVARTILNKYGPFLTTSVNLSGSLPLNSYEEITKHFGDRIDYIIEDVETTSNVSSTVVDATSHPFRILRQGDIIIK